MRSALGGTTPAQARRRGVIGGKSIVGWTRAGRIVLGLARAGRIKRCVICRRPNLARDGKPRGRPYCKGSIYADTCEPARFYRVEECQLKVFRGSRRTPFKEWKLSWVERKTHGCNDEFYNRYYRAWHITCRVVAARDGLRCAGYGRPPHEWSETDRFILEYDHIVEVAAGGDPFDPANVQRLCQECHRRKTNAFLARRTSQSGSLHPDQTKIDRWIAAEPA